MLTPEQIENKLDRILLKVQKPGRYVGGAGLVGWAAQASRLRLLLSQPCVLSGSHVSRKLAHGLAQARSRASSRLELTP